MTLLSFSATHRWSKQYPAGVWIVDTEHTNILPRLQEFFSKVEMTLLSPLFQTIHNN